VVDLLEAPNQLLAQGVEHDLWLAGGTPDEGAKAEPAVRGAAGAHVRFLGPQPPELMPSLYR
jgi:hypothetical protein